MASSGTNLVGGRGEQNLKRSPASLSANQLSVDRVHLNTFSSAIDHPDEHNAIVSADDQHADDADNADDQHADNAHHHSSCIGLLHLAA